MCKDPGILVVSLERDCKPFVNEKDTTMFSDVYKSYFVELYGANNGEAAMMRQRRRHREKESIVHSSRYNLDKNRMHVCHKANSGKASLYFATIMKNRIYMDKSRTRTRSAQIAWMY